MATSKYPLTDEADKLIKALQETSVTAPDDAGPYDINTSSDKQKVINLLTTTRHEILKFEKLQNGA